MSLSREGVSDHLLTPPAERREVNATWLGSAIMSRMVESTKMTVMAFLGCPAELGVLIHFEPGRIPSRAIAKTRREDAVTAQEVD